MYEGKGSRRKEWRESGRRCAKTRSVAASWSLLSPDRMYY